MAPRKPIKKQQATVKTKLNTKTKKEIKPTSNWTNLFRFGESYSSLLLGIVVVIITTVLLVFLVKDRNTNLQNAQKDTSSATTQNNENKIAQGGLTPTTTVTVTLTPEPTKVPTAVPTKRPTQIPTAKPTVKPTAQVTVKPTAKPTTIPSVKPTIKPTTAPTSTPATTRAVAQVGNGKTHTVAQGENLWGIAEKYYKSGYNWIDISKANKLENPGVITVGMKLSIPEVAPKTATLETASQTPAQSEFGPKIVGSTYTIQKGDHLWGIAVRAYNDGYKWVELARVNNITTPNLIEAGKVIKIPRTAVNK